MPRVWPNSVADRNIDIELLGIKAVASRMRRLQVSTWQDDLIAGRMFGFNVSTWQRYLIASRMEDCRVNARNPIPIRMHDRWMDARNMIDMPTRMLRAEVNAGYVFLNSAKSQIYFDCVVIMNLPNMSAGKRHFITIRMRYC